MKYFEIETHWTPEGLPSKEPILLLVPGYDMDYALERIEASKYSTGEVVSIVEKKYDDVLSE